MNLIKLWQWACTGPWVKRAKDTEYKWGIDSDNNLLITFMGSSQFKTKDNKVSIDWRHNIDIIAKPYKGMKPIWFAHRGFKSKWKVIEDEVLELITTHQPTGVLLTGFSQGAAIAGLAHESMWYNFPEYREKLHTKVFGCPRFVWFWNKWKIGNRWENFIRIESRWDLVTKVPPILFGYTHVGEAIKIGHKWWQVNFRFKHNHLHYGKYL